MTLHVAGLWRYPVKSLTGPHAHCSAAHDVGIERKPAANWDDVALDRPDDP